MSFRIVGNFIIVRGSRNSTANVKRSPESERMLEAIKREEIRQILERRRQGRGRSES